MATLVCRSARLHRDFLTFALLGTVASAAQCVAAAPARATEEATTAELPEQPSTVREPYLLAVGGRLALGDGGFDTELGMLSEVFGRYQWRYGLGLQASYFHLEAPNNEAYPTFTADALTLGPTWHPLRDLWFDPFVEAHAVSFVRTEGTNFYSEDPGRFGGELVGGVQLASRYVAGGFNYRLGCTSRTWSMAGIQLELRL
jgi:hypothetical protein